jgi:hypothetical protein
MKAFRYRILTAGTREYRATSKLAMGAKRAERWLAMMTRE